MFYEPLNPCRLSVHYISPLTVVTPDTALIGGTFKRPDGGDNLENVLGGRWTLDDGFCGTLKFAQALPLRPAGGRPLPGGRGVWEGGCFPSTTDRYVVTLPRNPLSAPITG